MGDTAPDAVIQYYSIRLAARISQSGSVTFKETVNVPGNCLDSWGWAASVFQDEGRIVHGDASFQVEAFRYWSIEPTGTGIKRSMVEVVVQAYHVRAHESEENSRNLERYGGSLPVGCIIFIPYG